MINFCLDYLRPTANVRAIAFRETNVFEIEETFFDLNRWKFDERGTGFITLKITYVYCKF